MTAGGGLPVLTPSATGVACQWTGEIPASNDMIDAQIMVIKTQLLMPVVPPQLRALLTARLTALQAARGAAGPSAPARTASPAGSKPAVSVADEAAERAKEAALAQFIDDHPAWGWGFHGGKGTPEGYAEIEANTSGSDFEQTDLFRAWYFGGWAAIRNRPDSAQALRTIAFHLITDPATRAGFLASVGLEAGSAQPLAPPRALQGPLDETKLSDADKRAEIDAIRVWQQRHKLDPQTQDRLTGTLTRLAADLEKTRAIEEATAAGSAPVTFESYSRAEGARKGDTGPFGQYANVDIDVMARGRPELAGSRSETDLFTRFVYRGKEISTAEAQRVIDTSTLTGAEYLEPSAGAADRFVVWPELWQLASGDQLVVEHWWLIQADPDKAYRIRRLMISQHRGRTIPTPVSEDPGMGMMGETGLAAEAAHRFASAGSAAAGGEVAAWPSNPEDRR